MAVLVADDVSRRYGDTVALDGVSLDVSEGEIFGLVGPNGAGKTTLVRALTGTTEVDGHVELFGTSPQSVDGERIGLLPQDFDPPERLTARELLAYFGGLYDDPEPADALLEAVGMEANADTYYENLSGGQQRRTCVATALVNDPELLVVDEPTTGIDPAGRRQLWQLLEELAADGTTIFITTHYMEEAEELADRVGLLANGELVALDTPSALIETYGGDSLLYIDGEFEDDVTGRVEYECSLADGQLTLRNVPPEDIGRIVTEAEAAGATVDSLTWTDPDLEDVYLELTDQNVTERRSVEAAAAEVTSQ
ncbi:ABC-2 type transport system ATP-binding protein [Halovenus aranensis]|jgi:ABC-2 type transport system ATP-binding protein|uniref:ABC-2 type transport system ATP-binding protein n=1 Tax=Halovenus aranensis TaxID=890420 RepID=A0A1G8U6V2_9EURY|nr:ABC transporter ATP-binding protein [Halovenus aranensis]SDJ49546.1 ABC-2 type transport system ATP-binding protein [Halovenus aranensis]